MFCLVETVYFCSELFFCCCKPIGVGQILKEKHFPAIGNHFIWFSCQKKQILCIVKCIFQRMAHSGKKKRIFWLMQTIFYIFFRDSCWGKIYFPSSGNVFLNESFIKILLSNGHHHFTWKFLSTRGNRHCYEWRPIFKDKIYSCWWKLTLWLVETIFHWLIYFSRSPSFQLAETHFSVQKKKIVFYSELSFLLLKTNF